MIIDNKNNSAIINYEERYDLFQNGNYVCSFINKDEIEKYFQSIFDKNYPYYSDKDKYFEDFLKNNNAKRYTIVKSEHLTFV